jgi:hypothetical protein
VAAAEWRARPGEGDFWKAYEVHSSSKKQETAQANPGLTTVSVSEIPGDMALLYSHEARSNLIRIIIGTYHYLDWPSSDADGGASAAANVNLNGVAAVGKELNTGDTGDQEQLGQAGSTQDVPQTFESFLSRQH